MHQNGKWQPSIQRIDEKPTKNITRIRRLHLLFTCSLYDSGSPNNKPVFVIRQLWMDVKNYFSDNQPTRY